MDYGGSSSSTGPPPSSPVFGQSQFEAGVCVEVHGLESESGRALNGHKGFVSRWVEDKGRYEVHLFQGEKTVSIKPQNLRRVQSSTRRPSKGSQDAIWRRGDQCRLVGLLDPACDKALHPLNSALGTLLFRIDDDTWFVEAAVPEMWRMQMRDDRMPWFGLHDGMDRSCSRPQVQSKQHKIKVKNLRVCTVDDDDPRGVLSLQLWSRVILGVGLFATMMLMLEAELMVQRVVALRERGSLTPGLRVAALAITAPTLSLFWIVGTVAACWRLHSCLRDPEVFFPQISELAVGPRSAKVIYRIGFSAAAALLGAMVYLHQELALPHLPGGRDSEPGADFTWYGLVAAAGVAVQGVFLLQPSLTRQTLVHLAGALFFFYGAWCHMGAAGRLYQPMPPTSEDAPDYDELLAAAEEASASALLQHPAAARVVWFRHSILMRAPIFVFVVPLYSQLAERAPVSTPGATSPAARSMMGLAQWLIVFNFALVFVSYGPELVVAAMIPLPPAND